MDSGRELSRRAAVASPARVHAIAQPLTIVSNQTVRVDIDIQANHSLIDKLTLLGLMRLQAGSGTRPTFACATNGKLKEIMKKKLLLLFGRSVASNGNGGANGNKKGQPPEIRWPYVMNSSVPILGPIFQGSWIWHHHHRRWHHAYYRTRPFSNGVTDL